MKKLATIFVLILSWGLISTTAEAQIWIVNNNPGGAGHFNTFQEAHDGVSEGDTLYMVPSSENYTISSIDKELHIYGNGFSQNHNEIKLANNQKSKFEINEINADGTSINSVYLTQSSTLDLNANNIIISKSRIITGVNVSGTVGTLIKQSAITFTLSGGGNDGMLINSIIKNGRVSFNGTLTNNVIEEIGSISNSIISNNIILDSNENNVSTIFGNSEENTISNNIFLVIDEGYLGDNNLFKVDLSSLFVDFEDGESITDGEKYQLSATSPARGAGTNGDDIGIYGGANPYQLSGLPDIPHITAFTAPATGSSNTGLPVSITIESNN